ncbi:hypothetical protein GQ54DRAFT_212368 [Martensiomyces pterosporus]|nr:hypothetical protein GQ54DRAFT_212368 [Martensiomyces pterosporus]
MHSDRPEKRVNGSTMGQHVSDGYDKSIHRLLDEIQEHKHRATQLVSAIEQSMYVTASSTPTPSAPPIDPLPEPVARSPPDSFFEGFTRDFIENYQPQETVLLPSTDERRKVCGTLTRQLEKGGSGRWEREDEEQDLPGDYGHGKGVLAARRGASASVYGDSSTADPVAPHAPLDAKATPRRHQRSSDMAPRPKGSRSREAVRALVPDTSFESSAPPGATERGGGITKIDRSARGHLWVRANAVDKLGVHEDGEREEARIRAIVGLAERIIGVQPPNACGTDVRLAVAGSPASAESRISPAPKGAFDTALDRGQHKRALAIRTDHRNEETLRMGRWVDGEWNEWSEYINSMTTTAPGSGGAARRSPLALASHESMAERLEWVHERQPGMWRHGFHDTVLPSGKLQRTYEVAGLCLQAYPDGNVKRTASIAPPPRAAAQGGNGGGSSGGMQDARTATTLFFANGDWMCTIVEPRAGPASGREMVEAVYYYYSQEQVWHVQDTQGVEYRYPDGRVERMDKTAGCHTVTLPSGETQVSLARR